MKVTDVPKNFEVWLGGPSGLRLRKHQRMAEALKYLDECPMVIRQGLVHDASRLSAAARPGLALGSMPVFRRSSVGETVELSVEVDCPPGVPQGAPFHFARLFVETADTLLEEHLVVKPGKRQSFTLPFPTFTADTEFKVSMELRDLGDAGRAATNVTLRPEKRLTLYYAFQTHLDLGWTGRVAPTIEALKKMTGEVAINVCRQYMDRPEGQRFVWTCECSDALRLAWDGANHGQREVLREFLRRGLIQACAFPFSFHTGLMSRDLLRRSIERSFALRQEIGVEEMDLSVAQSNDVPGQSWIVPDVLAEMGIRRAMLGHNTMTRGCLLPPLFYWQGPAGGKVLTLATGCVDYGAVFPVPKSPREFLGLSVNNPESLQMPGTAVMRFIGYGENCGPEGAEREINAIAAWNEEFAWPKLVIGGPKDYFNHIEPELDPTGIPVVGKEFSDWWIHGPASMPQAMAGYRRAMIGLPHLARQIPETAAADRARLAELEENLILHAEHTFGLNAQLARPTSCAQGWKLDGMQDYVHSWEDKERYGARALELLGELQRTYPSKRDSAPPGHGSWKIEWDTAGILRLTDHTDQCWYDRSLLKTEPMFGCITQQLLDKELDEWFHHNPPEAPNAGDYHFQLGTIAEYADAASCGVVMTGRLESPSGAIERVVIKVGNAADSPDLIIHVELLNKQATAQAECLTMALPFLAESPVFKIDVGEALLAVDDDQAVDANRDSHPVITGWMLGDRQKPGRLAVSSAELFLWHFGDRRFCRWNHAPAIRAATAYAHLFNNVWNTNFRCWLGGNLHYTCRIRRCAADPVGELRQMSELW